MESMRTNDPVSIRNFKTHRFLWIWYWNMEYSLVNKVKIEVQIWRSNSGKSYTFLKCYTFFCLCTGIEMVPNKSTKVLHFLTLLIGTLWGHALYIILKSILKYGRYPLISTSLIVTFCDFLANFPKNTAKNITRKFPPIVTFCFSKNYCTLYGKIMTESLKVTFPFYPIETDVIIVCQI